MDGGQHIHVFKLACCTTHSIGLNNYGRLEETAGRGNDPMALLQTEFEPVACVIASKESSGVFLSLRACSCTMNQPHVSIQASGNSPLLTAPGLSACKGALSPPFS
jgi:hypothetical protein